MRFNNEYGESFVVPEPFIGKVGARIMALQEPTRKMDKSDPNTNNTIYLLDDPKLITKKCKSAQTDSGSEIRFAEDKPGVANLLSVYSALSGKPMAEIEAHFAGKMYGHLKVELAELVCATLAPVQAKHADLMKNQDYLQQVIRSGADRARDHAAKTLARVYDKVGFIPKGGKP
jgi:tryptophanyl-tRNA synthetase